MSRVVLFALAMFLAAQARAATIGFAQVGSESDWRRAFTADVQREAARRGIDLVFSDADNDVERERAAVRGFIARHVDAIVIAPVVNTGWTDTLSAAHAAGIPVFIADRAVDADPTLFVSRISPSAGHEGRLAGAWLAQATGGNCPVVEVRGTTGSEPAIQRHLGLLAVTGLFPQIRILRAADGNFTTEGGRDAMAALLRQTNNLHGVCAVVSQNDDMMLGAFEAMRGAGVRPGRDVLTVSFDGGPRIFRAMLDGDATMSVEVTTRLGGPIFDVVQGYLAGRRDYPKWVVVPTRLHTKADAAAMLGNGA